MSNPAEHSRFTKFYSEGILGLLLVIIVTLAWCTIYNRWSADSWQTPLTYREEPVKGDVLLAFAWVKAAQHGHYAPLLHKNVPELGAPYDANWNDFPVTEDLLIALPGLLAPFFGIFAALNLTVLLAHVLCALAFYIACRLIGCLSLWAFCGAIVFAFSRYAFAQGEHHFTIAYYWHVPLCLVVCGWVLSPEGIGLKGRRLLFAIAVAFVTGLQNVYYTNMFAQLVLFGGVIQWMRKGWRAALPAAALIGVSAAAFLLMNADTFSYHFVHGSNPAAVVRPYKWVELGGLKVVDLLMPPPDHPFGRFATWSQLHLRQIVLPPGEWPPTGYLGLVGIAALAWLAIASFKRVVRPAGEGIPMESWQVLWILLYAGVGGLNGFAGTLGVCLFRGASRYSIFILAIGLMYAAKRLSQNPTRHSPLPYVAGFLLVLLALWDQVPPRVTLQQIQSIAAAVDSDRQFTREMEKRLPRNAMVFQIPIMEFPESPAVGVGSYDHFRPYLYSDHLRYSFGSVKGRARERWQHSFGEGDLRLAVEAIESYGFAAIYVNKRAFADNGAAFYQLLAGLGKSEKIESQAGDLGCVFLKPSDAPKLPWQ